MTEEKRHFTIVGAGLAGSLMAVYLARKGHRVSVFERRRDPRQTGVDGGRSINLALSCRGLTALEEVGLDQKILEQAIPMRGRLLHDKQGNLKYVPYSASGEEAINSVSRGGLNLALIEAAEAEETVSVRFGCKARQVDLDTARITFEDGESGEVFEHDAGVIIGADGAFSAVRTALTRRDRADYSQDYLAHGYKELTIPAVAGAEGDARFRIGKNALHIWPRGEFMMIALPNADGSFTCTLFWPYEGEHGVEQLTDPEQVQAFFEQEFKDSVPLIPKLKDEFLENPTGSLVTVRCWPWHLEDKAVLIGDASHAIVPFYGQGINAGFEDCRILNACLEQYPDDLQAAFAAYAKERKPNCDTLAQLALDNYVEMRDSTATFWFQAKKKIEHTLTRMFPGSWKTLYSMVSFSNIPYAEAVERSKKQDRLLASGLTVVALLLLGLAVGGAVWAANSAGPRTTSSAR